MEKTVHPQALHQRGSFLPGLLGDAWSHIVSCGWGDVLVGHLRRKNIIQG